MSSYCLKENIQCDISLANKRFLEGKIAKFILLITSSLNKSVLTFFVRYGNGIPYSKTC